MNPPQVTLPSENWELASLMPVPGTAEFQERFEGFAARLASTVRSSERLQLIQKWAVMPSDWIDFLETLEQVETEANDLESCLACYAAADAENKEFQRFEGRLAALQPQREQVVVNLENALRSADDSTFEHWLGLSPATQRIAFFLRKRRELARLRLPQDQEMLAAELAVDGIHAWGRLYDRISGELRVEVMERGEVRRKSVGQVTFDSADRSHRENNFYAANRAWQQIGDTCADALNHIAGTRLTVYRRLDVADHLDIPCQLNHMRRATLDTMWRVVSERKSVLVPYLQQKAQALRLQRLSWYDLSAPWPHVGPVQSGQPTYSTACETIVDSFQKFSPQLADFARHAIARQWIEAENREGKRQGGFCTDFPGSGQSRIFMTFTPSIDSMSTLAHELGHAYHTDVLASEPPLMRRYPMNLAETASTFAEAVLIEEQLRDENDVAKRIRLLDTMLSDAVGFLMNIHARFLFEDRFYTQRADGELSAEQLSDLMTQAQRDAYLEQLDPDGLHPMFWASKLHFFITEQPFYNFPYTFGYLLSLGLFALGRSQPDFPAAYRQFLIATAGSDTEAAVASCFGFDLTQPDFWNQALDVVAERAERFTACLS